MQKSEKEKENGAAHLSNKTLENHWKNIKNHQNNIKNTVEKKEP